MKENERKWKKMKENERRWKKAKEDERRRKKMWHRMNLEWISAPCLRAWGCVSSVAPSFRRACNSSSPPSTTTTTNNNWTTRPASSTSGKAFVRTYSTSAASTRRRQMRWRGSSGGMGGGWRAGFWGRWWGGMRTSVSRSARWRSKSSKRKRRTGRPDRKSSSIARKSLSWWTRRCVFLKFLSAC